jgi:predicted HTH transcriptional regulator
MNKKELNQILQKGEGQFVEFKENFDKDLAKEIVAFDEQVCPGFDFKDFDDEKFEYYLTLANISKILDKKDILRNLRVLTPISTVKKNNFF